MPFVDCLKIAGVLQDLKVFKNNSDNVEVILKIDGHVIPNMSIPKTLYEEINIGEHYEFFGVFKKSKDKEKSKGILFAFKSGSGRTKNAPSMRFTVLMMMALGAALWYGLTYVVTYAALIMPMAAKADNIRAAFGQINSIALLAGLIPVLFFASCAVNFIRKTGSIEQWRAVSPSTVSERFSKLHK